MRNHYIYKLIAQGEHQQLDFKFEISDASKIARTLVAFANTDGGKLLIGVKDNGVIRGVPSEEEIFMLENAAHHYCKPEVVFLTKKWDIDNKTVLEAHIPKSPSIIHKAPDNEGSYRAYIRVKDENLLANGVQMKVWKKKKTKRNIKIAYTIVEEKLLKFLKENTVISLNQFRDIAGISRYKAESILADFILLNIITMNLKETGATFTLTDKYREVAVPFKK